MNDDNPPPEEMSAFDPRRGPQPMLDWPEPPPGVARMLPPAPADELPYRLPPPPLPPPPAPVGAARPWMLSALLLVLTVLSVGLGTLLYERHTTGQESARNLPAASGDLVAITNKVNPGVVNISTELGYQHGAAAGTGIVLTSSGEVLTNHHVIAGATTIKATDVDNGRTYSATVVGYDAAEDIAVLQLDNAKDLKTVELGNSDDVGIGDAIVAIGNALGRGGTPPATTGSVIALNQSITASDPSGDSEDLTGLIQVDARLQPGDSGGPLVNSNGQVIGIDTAASATRRIDRRGGQSIDGFAIPINKAMEIVRAIESGKGSDTIHIGPTGFLGIQMSGVSGSGAVIAAVVKGSPAESAGLAQGDTITSADGVDVNSAPALLAALRAHRPGDTVPIEWTDAAGATHSASVTLGTGPAA